MKLLVAFLLVLILNEGALADGNREKNAAKSETIELTGKITDSMTGEMLVGVEVKIKETNQKTYTDFDGNFKFEGVTPGHYKIVASYISYQSENLEIHNTHFLTDNLHVKLRRLN